MVNQSTTENSKKCYLGRPDAASAGLSEKFGLQLLRSEWPWLLGRLVRGIGASSATWRPCGQFAQGDLESLKMTNDTGANAN